MSNRSTKRFTSLAVALAVVVLSTDLSVAEDSPQIRMDPQFLEILSTFQKKASERSDAIIQNMKKGPDTSKNGTSADQTPDQAQKLMESLSNFQKKAFGTTDSGNQIAK